MANAPRSKLTEVDLSQQVRGTSNVDAALVGKSNRGMLNERVEITSAKQFVEEYGKPVPGTYFHYTALAYLDEGARIYCVRTASSSDLPLHAGAILIEDGASGNNYALSPGVETPSAYTSWSTNDCLLVCADNPGVWGNSVSIRVTHDDVDSEIFSILVYYPNDAGIDVLRETWRVSRVATKKDGYGKVLYVEDVINDNSKYIRVEDYLLADGGPAGTVIPAAQATSLTLTVGDNGTVAAASDIVTAWDANFANKNEVSVNMLLTGGEADGTVVTKLYDLAAARGDCTVISDTTNVITTTLVNTWRATFTLTSGTESYGAIYAGWVKDADNYNGGKILELPPSGYVAAVYARNERLGARWTAPYGYVRGMLPVSGVVKEWKDSDLDTMYANRINAIKSSPRGMAVWGQRTSYFPEGALAGVNVRRLLNEDEQAVLTFLDDYIGEENTEAVRTRIKAALDRYFRPKIGKGAYYDVVVVCDSTNNTSVEIDANKLVVDVYVQPVRIGDYIDFNLVIADSGVSLQEIAA